MSRAVANAIVNHILEGEMDDYVDAGLSGDYAAQVPSISLPGEEGKQVVAHSISRALNSLKLDESVIESEDMSGFTKAAFSQPWLKIYHDYREARKTLDIEWSWRRALGNILGYSSQDEAYYALVLMTRSIDVIGGEQIMREARNEIIWDFDADGPFTNDQVDAIARAWQAVVEEGIP